MILSICRRCRTLLQCIQSKNSLISYILGFSHEYTNSKEKIQQVAALSHKYKAPVYTHLSETEYEVNTCKEKTGRSPIEYLCDLGVYDYGGGAFHCVHMSTHDLDLFAKNI